MNKELEKYGKAYAIVQFYVESLKMPSDTEQERRKKEAALNIINEQMKQLINYE